MKRSARKRRSMSVLVIVGLIGLLLRTSLMAEPISLQALVTPSTVILKDQRPVTFAVHGFVEFKSLAKLFPYIESRAQPWKTSAGYADSVRRIVREQDAGNMGRDLLRRGIESRVISMTDERPLETLITHTREELQQALARVKEPTPPGYAQVFLAVQEKWKHSLNCWSAAPSIKARVLSNWYPIEEGIVLYGATYDSTEHFWQSVKYPPGVTVGEVQKLLEALEHRDWTEWLARLDDDPQAYLPNAYAV